VEDRLLLRLAEAGLLDVGHAAGHARRRAVRVVRPKQETLDAEGFARALERGAETVDGVVVQVAQSLGDRVDRARLDAAFAPPGILAIETRVHERQHAAQVRHDEPDVRVARGDAGLDEAQRGCGVLETAADHA
jgi:hypothetical protein